MVDDDEVGGGVFFLPTYHEDHPLLARQPLENIAC